MKREGSKCKPATPKELKWIEDFKELAKRCPPKLWLYATGIAIYVMKTPEDGNQNLPNHGVNPENIIDDIQIKNDGGDW